MFLLNTAQSVLRAGSHFQSLRKAKCGENDPPTGQLLPFCSGLQTSAAADRLFLRGEVCRADLQPAYM